MCWIKAAVGVFPFAKTTSAKIDLFKKGNHRRVNSFHIKSWPSGTCADTSDKQRGAQTAALQLTSVAAFQTFGSFQKRTIRSLDYTDAFGQCFKTNKTTNNETHQGKAKTVRPSHTGCWLCIETSSKTGRCQWANKGREKNQDDKLIHIQMNPWRLELW